MPSKLCSTVLLHLITMQKMLFCRIKLNFKHTQCLPSWLVSRTANEDGFAGYGTSMRKCRLSLDPARSEPQSSGSSIFTFT